LVFPRGRLAYSALSGRDERPFPTIDRVTRARIESLTGSTLEESYTGLTVALAVAIEAELGENV
jgi:hypothetical protein